MVTLINAATPVERPAVIPAERHLTLSLSDIVDKQAHYWAGFIPAWNVFIHPLAFLMFLAKGLVWLAVAGTAPPSRTGPA